MLKSKPVRRGQTAFEMLFIIGIFFVGLLLVVSPYITQSRDTSLITAVRDASSLATSYINAGVISNDSVFTPLNDIIKNYTQYENVDFRFIGLKTEVENSTEVIILVKFEHDLPENQSQDAIMASSLGKFLKGYLGRIRGFRWRNGHVYYGDRLITFNITVGETWEVIR